VPKSVAYETVPAIDAIAAIDIRIGDDAGGATSVGVLIGPSNNLPEGLELDWDDLRVEGFSGALGETFAAPKRGGPTLVLLGAGDEALTMGSLRDAAASLARSSSKHKDLAFDLGPISLPADEAAQAVAEGVLLARYRYDILKASPTVTAVESLVLFGADAASLEEGARKGKALAEAQNVARDLANDPPVVLTAARMAAIASNLGAQRGLDVEVYDKAALEEMGCGGLLGVNAGSAEPPRMIKLTYVPDKPNGHHLSLVGKGIMYDAGGIALKPADDVHATMKNDMSGAGAILAAMLILKELGCRTTVVGYLMCTDNRPSGTALAMGDVITIRGGKTVEVSNTDAEGRLVMADALVLATETSTDAIVDVATLTGAAMRALGTQVAGVIGNNQKLVDQVRTASEKTDESVWQLPLERRYRNQLNSPVADIRNLGGPNAGAITAALFLDEFVDGRPWAHIDIAGVAQNEADISWHPPGCTGFGARLIAEFALDFQSTGDGS
jgi:leucyl aminopeptidase